MAQIDLKYCTITIKDGTTPTPNSIEVKIGEGNLTYSEKVNREYVKNRGLLDIVRDGDEEPVELKLDATWEYIKEDSGQTPTIEDALKQRGGAYDWVSVDSDTCQPYAVDIELEYAPNCNSDDKETLVFSEFRYEQVDHDTKAGTISISGKCNITEPTSTRVAQSS